jgi:hypothetical protein
MDGLLYKQIQTVVAKGNVQVQTSYQAVDVDAPAGDVYYQLEIIDRDGQKSYSKVILVQRKSSNEISIIGGNIVKDRLMVSFNNGTTDQSYKWSICNEQGQKIMNGMITPGSRLIIQTARLSAGFYHLQLFQGNKRINIPFLKQ